jgi:predicted metal-dependent phosphoesterase TrpH
MPDETAQILALGQTGDLAARGFVAADLHVHSIYSEDVLSDRTRPDTLVERARRQGLRFLSITDHDTMDAYVNVLGFDHEMVVPGVEIRIRDPRVGHTVHANVYTLDLEQFADLEGIAGGSGDIERFTAYCRAHDLPCQFNHPFWSAAGEPPPDPRAVADLMALFPVAEFNSSRVAEKNFAAARLAARLGKGLLANSDTHHGNVGRARSWVHASDFREFFERARRGEAVLEAVSLLPRDTVSLVRETLRAAFRFDRRILDELGVRAPKGDFCGVPILDNLVRAIVHGHLDPFPRLKRALRCVLEGVSSLRVLQYLYFRGELREARRIGDVVNL